MPSQQVIEKLEQLKSELQNLKSSAQIVNQAADVAANSAEVITAFPNFLSSLELDQGKHLNMLSDHHKEIVAGLEEQIQSLLTDDIPAMLNQMREQQLMIFSKGISDQSARLSELMNNFEQSVKIVETAMKEAGNELLLTSKQLSNYILELGKLSDTIHKYLNDIHQINFPARLEKLDATTAGIMAAVQSAQSRIDLSERNLSDALKNMLELSKNHQSALDARLESMKTSFETKLASQQKKQLTHSVITWILIAACIAASVYFSC